MNERDDLTYILDKFINVLARRYGYFVVLTALEEAVQRARKHTGLLWTK